MTASAVAADGIAATVDAFLGGRVEAVQAGRGHHRAGLEAVLLGATFAPDFVGTIVDLGAGSGVAGMVAAARCAKANAILVDRDETAIACARAALARPANRAFAGRVSVVAADVGGRGTFRAGAGLADVTADAVITNPPFHLAASGTVSPGPARASAHVLDPGGLEPWLRAAASILKPRGEVVVIFRADGLDVLFSAMASRFGGLDILPIHPRPDAPAHRILVRGVKGSRAASRLLPPLILHGEAGSAYLPQVERILRDGAGLAEVHPPWRAAR